MLERDLVFSGTRPRRGSIMRKIAYFSGSQKAIKKPRTKRGFLVFGAGLNPRVDSKVTQNDQQESGEDIKANKAPK